MHHPWQEMLCHSLLVLLPSSGCPLLSDHGLPTLPTSPQGALPGLCSSYSERRVCDLIPAVALVATPKGWYFKCLPPAPVFFLSSSPTYPSTRCLYQSLPQTLGVKGWTHYLPRPDPPPMWSNYSEWHQHLPSCLAANLGVFSNSLSLLTF